MNYMLIFVFICLLFATGLLVAHLISEGIFVFTCLSFTAGLLIAHFIGQGLRE